MPRFSRLRVPLAVAALVLSGLDLAAVAPAAFPRPARVVTAARIVSLMPSITEDLFAIGAGARVVASSAYTDYPAAARSLPQLSSFDGVDAERIEALHPDLVLGDRSQGALVRDLRRIGLRVELIDEDSYGGIFSNLRRLGDLTAHRAEADRLAAHLQRRTAALRALPGVRNASHPRVFVVLGVAPIYTIGERSYIATLLGFAGMRNAASGLATAYAPYDAEALVASDPDAIVADPSAGLKGALDRAPWNALRAVRDHHVYEIADVAALERPGPRYNDGLAWLIERVKAGSR